MYSVNGLLLERWFLKTVVNMFFTRKVPDNARWSPSDRWVQTIFGDEKFVDRCGLYLLLERWLPMQAAGKHYIGVRALFHETGRMIGGQFRLNEYEFVLTMEPLMADGRDYYRPIALKDKRLGRLNQILRFDWSELSLG